MPVVSEQDKVGRLVDELTTKVGLEPVNAYRSAFIALAVAEGWTKARVGRCLGISRARVGQRIDKLTHYTVEVNGTPTLRAVMNRVHSAPKPKPGEYDDIVAYELEDWTDLDFARRMCARFTSVHT